MAGGRRSKAKQMELEAKHVSEEAWYDCIVSVSSKNSSLEVEGVEPEITGTAFLSNLRIALAQLRAQSEPLAGTDCLQVKEGQVVLAQRYSGRRLWFEAKVEKVRRSKHAPRGICRCNFEVRWLEGKSKGDKATIRADTVRRLVNDDISKHPVIAEWLHLQESEGCAITSGSHSDSSFAESDIAGDDIQTRLEQQIEQISQSVDVESRSSGGEEPKASVKQDSRQQNCRGRKRTRPSATDLDHVTDLTISLDSTPSKYPVREISTSKGTGTKVNPIQAQKLTSILQEEKRPRLSPLAARAALAAAMQESHELSHKESRSPLSDRSKQIIHKSDGRKLSPKRRVAISSTRDQESLPGGRGFITSAEKLGVRRSSRLSIGSTTEMLQSEEQTLAVTDDAIGRVKSNGRSSSTSMFSVRMTASNTLSEQKQTHGRSSRFDGTDIAGELSENNLLELVKVNPSACSQNGINDESLEHIRSKISATDGGRRRKTRAHLASEENMGKIIEESFGGVSCNDSSSVSAKKDHGSFKLESGKPEPNVSPERTHRVVPRRKGNRNKPLMEQKIIQTSSENKAFSEKSEKLSSKVKQDSGHCRELANSETMSSSKSKKKGLNSARKKSAGFLAVRTSRRLRRRNIPSEIP